MEHALPENITMLAAFAAGLLSFLSPCVLPLIPGYISFISGTSMKELTSGEEIKRVRGRVLLSSLFFVLGFSAVFIALGASATAIGKILLQYIRPLSIAAGAIIIIIGIHLTGMIKIPLLYREKRIQTNTKPVGFLGAFIIGLAFAFGWTPCIGPILAGILAVAGSQETVAQGIVLLTVYSLGLGIPFMLTALSITLFFKAFDKIKKYFNIIEWVSGLLLIVIGVLMITGGLTIIAAWLSSLGSLPE